MDSDKAVKPRELLSVPDGIFLVAGMVIGIGIFKLPGLVAANAASPTHFFLAWIIGGIACLCGALVYAEVASRYPETGGEYLLLRRQVESQLWPGSRGARRGDWLGRRWR
mgnify:CR=1 FL=1